MIVRWQIAAKIRIAVINAHSKIRKFTCRFVSSTQDWFWISSVQIFLYQSLSIAFIDFSHNPIIKYLMIGTTFPFSHIMITSLSNLSGMCLCHKNHPIIHAGRTSPDSVGIRKNTHDNPIEYSQLIFTKTAHITVLCNFIFQNGFVRNFWKIQKTTFISTFLCCFCQRIMGINGEFRSFFHSELMR